MKIIIALFAVLVVAAGRSEAQAPNIYSFLRGGIDPIRDIGHNMLKVPLLINKGIGDFLASTQGLLKTPGSDRNAPSSSSSQQYNPNPMVSSGVPQNQGVQNPYNGLLDLNNFGSSIGASAAALPNTLANNLQTTGGNANAFALAELIRMLQTFPNGINSVMPTGPPPPPNTLNAGTANPAGAAAQGQGQGQAGQ